MRRILTLAVGIAVVGIGCGESPEDKATAAVGEYINALKAADGRRACGLLTEDGRAAAYELVRSAPKEDPTDITTGDFEPADAKVCARLHDEAMSEVLNVRSIQAPSAKEADVDGDTATVGGYRLEERAGDWLLTVLEPLEDAQAPPGLETPGSP